MKKKEVTGQKPEEKKDDDLGPFEDGFVKYPPFFLSATSATEGEIRNLRLAVLASEFDGETFRDKILPLIIGVHDFSKKGNAMDGALCFMLAHEAGVYPSVSILEWLNEGFKKWMESYGQGSLERFLGLKGGRGVSTPFKEKIRDIRMNDLMFEILNLNYLFKIPVEVAATDVMQRFRMSYANPKKRFADIFGQYRKKFAGHGEHLDQLSLKAKKALLEPYLHDGSAITNWMMRPRSKNKKLLSFLKEVNDKL